MILEEQIEVALRKESVDRNEALVILPKQFDVALRKESVDRNHIRNATAPRPSIVALRKESVDRNSFVSDPLPALKLSLSARRAWIEILLCPFFMASQKVALRKESVDRNLLSLSSLQRLLSRSPQGERG